MSSMAAQKLLHRLRETSLPQISRRLGYLTRTNSEALLGVRMTKPPHDYTKGVAITSSWHPDETTHIVHVNVFLSQMSDFEAMNAAYIEKLGGHRPARTVIGVRELPKPGVLLTMNLTAVTAK